MITTISKQDSIAPLIQFQANATCFSEEEAKGYIRGAHFGAKLTDLMGMATRDEIEEVYRFRDANIQPETITRAPKWEPFAVIGTAMFLIILTVKLMLKL